MRQKRYKSKMKHRWKDRRQLSDKVQFCDKKTALMENTGAEARLKKSN